MLILPGWEGLLLTPPGKSWSTCQGESKWSLTDSKWPDEVLSFPNKPVIPLPKTEILGGYLSLVKRILAQWAHGPESFFVPMGLRLPFHNQGHWAGKSVLTREIQLEQIPGPQSTPSPTCSGKESYHNRWLLERIFYYSMALDSLPLPKGIWKPCLSKLFYSPQIANVGTTGNLSCTDKPSRSKWYCKSSEN